jgi:hypothetical protein
VGGVTCQECHGKVEEMDIIKQIPDLSMGWCISCHRSRNLDIQIIVNGINSLLGNYAKCIDLKNNLNIEAGMFLGFAGLFSLVVAMALSKAKIIPSNHPYLEESIDIIFSEGTALRL